MQCNIHIKSGQVHAGDLKKQLFDPQCVYPCWVKYPFNCGFILPFQGTNLGDFLKALKKGYEAHYKKVDANKVLDGYCHGLEDLYLESVDVNNYGVISINIGS